MSDPRDDTRPDGEPQTSTQWLHRHRQHGDVEGREGFYECTNCHATWHFKPALAASAPSAGLVERLRAKLEVVKKARRDNTLSVFALEHLASWEDIEEAADALDAQAQTLARVERNLQSCDERFQTEHEARKGAQELLTRVEREQADAQIVLRIAIDGQQYAGRALYEVEAQLTACQRERDELIAALITACHVALDWYGLDGDHISDPARSQLRAVLADAQRRGPA